MSDEAKWREYVIAYDIEVPEERVREEVALVRADMKHRMMYEHMSGGESHPFPDAELAEQKDAIFAAALFEAKEPLVLKDLTSKLGIEVTPEELLAEAKAIAKRQGSTVDEVRRFFGEDLRFLERDVRERKIRSWACSQ